jgi:hypothetical protein
MGLDDSGAEPRETRLLHRASGIGARYVPDRVNAAISRRQRAGSRLLSPLPATDDRGANLVDAGPLYAGETVARISSVRPAAELVAELTP